MKNLLKRGVEESVAIACGVTGKGPWRSSKTQGINKAIGNEFLKGEGLVSLRDVWINIHYG